MSQLLLGAHTSTAGGLHNALTEGAAIGATTVQIFTSNQRQWKGRVLTEEILTLWDQHLSQTGLKNIMSHASYLINLGSPNEETLAKSLAAFKEELHRCHKLSVTYLNFHPGAAVGATLEQCLDQIVASLLQIEPVCQEGNTRLLLESTAGQGTCVGYDFEHLKYIIERTEHKLPIGVCIDTCHSFVAGYDLRDQASLQSTLKEFDKVVGLDKLYALHLNDSVKGLGSKVDRHAHLGEGQIGIDCFKAIVQDPLLQKLSLYLETPGGPPRWKEEIELLKNFYRQR